MKTKSEFDSYALLQGLVHTEETAMLSGKKPKKMNLWQTQILQCQNCRILGSDHLLWTSCALWYQMWLLSYLFSSLNLGPSGHRADPGKKLVQSQDRWAMQPFPWTHPLCRAGGVKGGALCQLQRAG